MEVLIVVVCLLLAAALAVAIVLKAVSMAKQARRYKQELAEIRDSDKYLLDIVQGGKTVRIECKDVNSDNVELVSQREGEE